jgi:L-malate glycosyltransferase
VRILVLSPWYPTEAQPSPGVFVRDQVEALKTRHEVEVVAPEYPKSPIKWLNHRLWEQAAYDHAKSMPFMDLIHAHVVLPAGHLAVKLGRERGVPVVLTEHSSPFSMHTRRRWERRRTIETLAAVDGLVSVSEGLRSQMLRVNKHARVEVVGNLVDTEFFAPGPAGKKDLPTRFLMLGRLDPQKGFRYGLEAAAHLLLRGHSGFHLAIVGEGPARTDLEGYVRNRLNHPEYREMRCSFKGELDREGVRRELRASDCLLAPSLHETFGLVVAEALACGKPVITTRCGGIEGLIDERMGLVVEPGDPFALAGAMLRVMRGGLDFDPVRARAAIESRFSVSRFLDSIDEVYQRSLRSCLTRLRRGCLHNARLAS